VKRGPKIRSLMPEGLRVGTSWGSWAPPRQLRGLGSVVSSPSGSGAKLREDVVLVHPGA